MKPIIDTCMYSNFAVVQVTFECRVTGQSEIVEVEMVDSAQWSWDQLWYALLGYLESAQVSACACACACVQVMPSLRDTCTSL